MRHSDGIPAHSVASPFTRVRSSLQSHAIDRFSISSHPAFAGMTWKMYFTPEKYNNLSYLSTGVHPAHWVMLMSISIHHSALIQGEKEAMDAGSL
ncbi:MAG: hypothetical protein JKY10_08485 [Cohaesibacteraceae bacterium]|nr:hypothetical protein [Cohaesibacteraceae bacterium]